MSVNASNKPNSNTSPWRNPWVIGWVSLVVIVVAMNVVMVMFAIKGNPGIVADDFYDRGQDYEQNMLKRQARDPGWLMDVESPEYIELAQPTTFTYTVSGKEGEHVEVDRVVFYVYRPSDAKMDFSKEMTEVAPGEYTVEVSFPLKGAWDVLVSAKTGDDEYNTSLRLGVAIDWIP
jgi:nitrogen fixation protein FixH